MVPDQELQVTLLVPFISSVFGSICREKAHREYHPGNLGHHMGVASYTLIWLIGASFLARIIYLNVFRPAVVSPLARVPAINTLARYSVIWSIWAKYKWKYNHSIEKAHQTLGPVIVVAPNELSVNCVKGGVRTVYGAFDKSSFYGFFENFGYVRLLATGEMS